MTTTRRQFLRAIGAGAAVAAGFPDFARARGPGILIGETHPLTGTLAREGRLARQGIALAVAEINAAGGVRSMRGAPLTVMVLDNESKPPVAIATMEAFQDAGCAAVLGPYASALALVTTQEAEKFRIPHVLDAAVADGITGRGFRYTFRLGPTLSSGARDTLADFGALVKSMRLGLARVAIIYEDSPRGRTTAETLRKVVPAAGLEIVEGIAYDAGATSVTNEVLKVKAARAEVIMPVGDYAAHSRILRTLARQRVDAGAVLSVFGGAGSRYRLVDDLGALAEYVLDGNRWYDPRRHRAARVIAAFAKAYGEPFAYEWLLAYQSVHVLRDALERAGTADRDRLRDALATTDLRTPLVPYPITFDDTGQNPHARTVLTQIQRGTIAVVAPADIAQANARLPAPPWRTRL